MVVVFSQGKAASKRIEYVQCLGEGSLELLYQTVPGRSSSWFLVKITSVFGFVEEKTLLDLINTKETQIPWSQLNSFTILTSICGLDGAGRDEADGRHFWNLGFVVDMLSIGVTLIVSLQFLSPIW